MTTETPAPGLALLAPDTLFRGRYRVVRTIKTGGMGSVYEVVDDRTNARRALKVMLPTLVENTDMRARFSLEARVTGDIESDHIVRVHDAGVDEATGTPFIAMDLLRGEDLGSMVKRGGPLPHDEVVTYLTQAATALDKTHAAGIVHRDLKPDNLFVTRRDDGSPCVKILDFGIAKVIAKSQAEGTQALGTPLYMSPEQIRGKGDIGPAADVYALGQIAYTLLVGEGYWEQDKRSSESLFALLLVIVGGMPETALARAERRRGVGLPGGFDAWFARATQPEPADRFPDASAAAAALGPALDTPTVRLMAATAEVVADGMGVGWLRSPAHKVRLWAATGALVVAGVLGVMLLRSSPGGRTKPTAPAATSTPRDKLIEDALWLVAIGDFEAGHLKLMGLPDQLAAADDPDCAAVENAWAKWKLEQVDEAKDAAKKKEMLREIAAAPAVSPQHRKKAVERLQELKAEPQPR
jgi:serine/threonine-protein kinase